jgi:hypothetical protein
MSDSNPVPQVLGMLVFREYASPAEMQHTIGCLRLAADCLAGKLALEVKAGLLARLPPEAQARHAAEAARPKRKRGRPAKEPARVRDASDPAALSLEEARALEARQDAARADAARQQAAAGSPLLFADPPPLAAAD